MRDLKHALVLGGSGFIGSWLVDLLASQDIGITLLGRQPAANHPEGASVITGTITARGVADALHDQPADVVFHLAGSGSVPQSVEEPLDDLTHNLITTVEVLEGLRLLEQRPVLVFVSSAAVYGDSRYQPVDESHPQEPKSPYGVSKLAAEHYVRLYAQLHGIRALSTRPFSVYGPGQRKLAVYDLLVKMFNGERPLMVHGTPDVSRDFVFVGDVARALLDLAHAAPANGEAYNIATGTGVSLGELVSILIEVSGVDAEPRFTGEVRRGDPLNWTGDPTLALSLGVACDTPLREGLQCTAAWLGLTDERRLPAEGI